MTDKETVIWGPIQQQPGGQLYRVGSSTGATLPDQPESSGGERGKLTSDENSQSEAASDNTPQTAGPDALTPRTDAALKSNSVPISAQGFVDFTRQLKRELAELERNHLGEGTFTCTCNSYPHAPNCGLDERLIALTEQLAEANARAEDWNIVATSAAHDLADERKAREEAEGKLAAWLQLHDAIAEMLGTTSAAWPEHRNAPLAIAASFALRESAESRGAQMFEQTKERAATICRNFHSQHYSVTRYALDACAEAIDALDRKS